MSSIALEIKHGFSSFPAASFFLCSPFPSHEREVSASRWSFRARLPLRLRLGGKISIPKPSNAYFIDIILREDHSRWTWGRDATSGRCEAVERYAAKPAAMDLALKHAQAAMDAISERPGLAAAAAATTVAVTATGIWLRSQGSSLKAGDISKDKVHSEFTNYDSKFQMKDQGKPDAQAVADDQEVPGLVSTFYNLVTDIYEWGWGQSFHFSPKLFGKTWPASEIAHETRLGALLRLKPGMKCLDVGCGVGGPMRTVAATSRAHVTGITINAYQVQRAKLHNKNMGLQEITDVVQGNFMEMPFENGSFDAAFACEATCHAPKLDAVYKEVFRVLKPGASFATYEWATTKAYDPSNPVHVKCIEDINYANALPNMRTYKECEEAAKLAGFEILESIDLSDPPALPWWDRLKMNKFQYKINSILVTILTFLRIAPKGTVEVHDMLVDTAITLTEGGASRIFTPMHLLLLKKPE